MQLQTVTTEGASARALISDCGRYRYTLERAWASIPRYVLWVMLNPSTADGTTCDPTIRRCVNFARSWNYTGILVANIYAWRATDPRELWRASARGHNIVGPENMRHVAGLLHRAGLVVCAWGKEGPSTAARGDVLTAIRRSGLQPHALRMNGTGEPAHPLRLHKGLRAAPWDVFRDPGNGHGG